MSNRLQNGVIPTSGDGRNLRTVAQVLVGAGPDGMLPPGALALAPSHPAGWFRKVRLMRRDATLGFLRDMYQAALLAAEWSIECDDERYSDAVEDIKESVLDFRIQFLRDALRGFLDFGWQPYEVVKKQRKDGTLVVTKYKGLLQDLTTILVDYYGELVGLRNVAIHNVLNPNPVYLYRGDFACLYRDAEGTNWYSEALLRRAERTYDSWNECDDGARRFDVKVAGAHWVIYYPPGTTPYKDLRTGNVEETDNAVIAEAVLNALSSSGKVAIPNMIAGQIDDLNSLDVTKIGWRVELLSAQTIQATFVERLRYLDSLKSRAFGFPERSALEGQFGTKAEAEVHADFAIDNMEMTHREILALLNKQVVDVLLEFNHGDEYKGHVKVTAAALNDDKRAMLKQIYTSHLGTESGMAEESQVVDMPQIREQLGIPVREDMGQAQGMSDIEQGDPDAAPQSAAGGRQRPQGPSEGAPGAGGANGRGGSRPAP